VLRLLGFAQQQVDLSRWRSRHSVYDG